MPGGALHLISAGALEGVSHVFGLHCDPSLDVGRIGLREGPLTGAADSLTVRLIGKGGHTSRPHLTEDLTFALGKVITELPAIWVPFKSLIFTIIAIPMVPGLLALVLGYAMFKRRVGGVYFAIITQDKIM